MRIVEKLSYLITRRSRVQGEGKSSPLLWLVYFCWQTFKRIKSAIILQGYSSQTIAAYFRKQGAQIGEGCDICVTELGPEPYLVRIGNHVFISKGVAFHTHDGGVWVLRGKIPDIRVYGPIVIEDNCIIGVNAMLLAGVRIGQNSIIGTGSVVITDIPPNSIAMGVPARVISSISKYEEKCLERWNEQRPPDLNLGKGPEWWRLKENRDKIKKRLLVLFQDWLNSDDNSSGSARTGS